jgi:hypothetical protein
MWIAAGVGVVLSLAAWGGYLLWPRQLRLPPPARLIAVVELSPGGARVSVPGRVLAAEVSRFDDELFAYLMFSYVRGLAMRDGRRAWLTCERDGAALAYVIRIAPGNDLLGDLPYLYRLQTMGLIQGVGYRWVVPDTIARYESQSYIFDKAYAMPARRKLERLPRSELVGYIRRFIRFKASTDPRIRRRIEPIPSPPDLPEAHRLAEDIVTVAEFYQLPVDFFLGIGAMENNYMHVTGDLGRAIWKRRAEKGDVILKRGPRGVLVLNEASGVWQITRETLRYAHRLYRKDRRDYSALPERLRPPLELNVNEVPAEALTTYAGLLFRDLLDRFDGDVATAVGAYNGGPGNPNPKYEAGVRTAADHARRVLEHAAALHGRPAAATPFLAVAR